MNAAQNFVEQTYQLSNRAPGAARRFVRSVFAQRAERGAAELAVSELITNVIHHATSTPRVTVRVSQAPVIRLEVVQHPSETPHPATPAPGTSRSWPQRTELTGRGLGIVDAISQDWGYERRGNDLVAWCEIPAT